MDKAEHGKRLKAAMATAGIRNQALADAIDVAVKTVGNWRSGTTMPDEADRAALRRILGNYDDPGDRVETAIRSSELIEWRQDAVLSVYKRNLHEQREERGA